MSAATMTAKQMIGEYFQALSGQPKTGQLIDKYVDDPGLKQHILQTEACFPNYLLSPIHIIAEGDVVAANCTFTATHTGAAFAGIEPTGKTINAGAMMFYQVADGRIVKFWMQVDMMSVFNQLKS